MANVKQNKTIVVVFKEGYVPRVFVNPESMDDLRAMGKVLVNPKIPRFSNPAQWYECNGRIKVKEEKVENLKTFPINRDRSHEKVQLDFENKLSGYKIEMAKKLILLESSIKSELDYKVHRESLKRTKTIKSSEDRLYRAVAILATSTLILSTDTVVMTIINIIDLIGRL